jgi:hypothetical protein
MKRILFALCVVCLGMLAIRPIRHKPSGSRTPAPPVARAASTATERGALLAAYGKLPLTFEANRGQADARVKFLAHGTGYTVFLTGDEATLLLNAQPGESRLGPSAGLVASANSDSVKHPAVAVRLALAGANPCAKAEALDLQPGESNYLIGNDPARWHRSIPNFARVKYHGVYPGVDLVYYGNQGQLESDYVLAPGASPRAIGVRIEGADKLKLDSHGDLLLSTQAGDVTLHRPRAYQQIAGSRQEIAANYVHRGPRVVGIEVAPYDTSQPLVIDPILSYSTYLGGATNQVLAGIAVDSSGFAYVTGYTSSTDFPTTTGALQTKLSNTSNNAFIAKLKQNGTGLVYSTFLGGTGSSGDKAHAIAVDTAGDAYITGFTSSNDFPIKSVSAYQSTNKGGGGFFTEIDPTGTTLVYSTYLSGSGSDSPNAIALDSNGNAYITGSTTSTDFPIVLASAVQTLNNTTSTQVGTAFLSRIDPTQSGLPSLVYSTFLGGSKQDAGLGVAVDSSFNAYLVGYTSSTDFPQPATPNGFQTTLKNPSGNIFVARIDTTQPALLVYSTYLGGSASGQGGSPGDVGTAIAVPAAGGTAYITGYTYSATFPTVAPLSTTSNTPSQKAIIAQINTTKSGAASVPYSTYFGGTVFTLGSKQPGADLGFGIALDSSNNMYVAGTTSSADFPATTGVPQPSKIGIQNAFLSELNPNGSTILFSTFLGGSNDAASSLALDTTSPPNAYIAGVTAGNFPTTVDAFQINDSVTSNNNSDGFVSKLSPGATTGVILSPAFVSFGNQVEHSPSAEKTVTLYNNTSATLTGITISFTGANATDFTLGTSTCTTTLAAGSNCTIEIIFTASTTATENAALTVVDSDPSSPQTIALTGTGTTTPTGIFLTPATVAFGNQSINTTSPAKIVTLSNNTTSPLSAIAVSIGGTSASLFAETTTCGTTLAAGAACTISVTFTPTAAAAATATLSVADSDPSGPQTAALTGTGTSGGPDFSIAVSPSSASVAAGSSVSFTVTVTALNGFTTPVALTCTGAPVNSTCTLSPTSLTPTASGATSTGSVVTVARSMGAMTAPRTDSFRTGPPLPIPVWLVALILVALAACVARRQPAARKLAWTFAILLALSQMSCSGLPPTGTPAGIYTLTITGTAGSSTHQTTVSLTVS